MTNKKKSSKVISMFSLKKHLATQAIKKANKLQLRLEKRNKKLENKYKKLHQHDEHCDHSLKNNEELTVIDSLK